MEKKFDGRETGEYCYLLDRLMGLESHARVSEDAEAGILEESVKTKDKSLQRRGTCEPHLFRQNEFKTVGMEQNRYR